MPERPSTTPKITTAKEAADDPLVLAFGHLQGAASRLAYLLGQALEENCGISHLVFEVLMIVGSAGPEGMPMRATAEERVLPPGGAPRLVDRRGAAALAPRVSSADDRRGRLVRLTAAGEETAVRAARLHAENV